jgi:hypothetical protein
MLIKLYEQFKVNKSNEVTIFMFYKLCILSIFRYDEMQRVEFERTGGTSRSFDVKITNVHDITYTFSSIGKSKRNRCR